MMRSNTFTVEVFAESPSLEQVIGEAVAPFGFRASAPDGSAKMTYSVGHSGWASAKHTVDVVVDSATHTVRLIDFSTRETPFDREVIQAVQAQVQASFGQAIQFSAEPQPAICLGP